MADENENDSEKTEDPSQYRIEEFRSKGQVAQSKEIAGVLVLTATFVVFCLSLVSAYETMDEYIRWLLEQDPKTLYDKEPLKQLASRTLTAGLVSCLPVFVAAIIASILSSVAQVGFLFAPDILTVDFERINPLEGAKKYFSMKMITEAVKGIIKFIIILSITYLVLKSEAVKLSGFLNTDLVSGVLWGKDLLFKLGLFLILGWAILAIADFAWEKFSYNNKLKQTKQQSKEELREKEGNPEIKQRIRTIQREVARKRMMNNVKKATVIVTNPTHLSVALFYDRESMVAPKILAKGADFMALKIREIAKTNDIPIVENVSLARTLYKTVKVGEIVPRTLYKAIAEILAFVYKINKKNKALG